MQLEKFETFERENQVSSYRIEIIPEIDNSSILESISSSIIKLKRDEWNLLLDENSSSLREVHKGDLFDLTTRRETSDILLEPFNQEMGSGAYNLHISRIRGNATKEREGSSSQSQISDIENELYDLKFIEPGKASEKSFYGEPNRVHNLQSKLKTSYFKSFKAFMPNSHPVNFSAGRSLKKNSSLSFKDRYTRSLVNSKFSKLESSHTIKADSKLKSFSKDHLEPRMFEKSMSPQREMYPPKIETAKPHKTRTSAMRLSLYSASGVSCRAPSIFSSNQKGLSESIFKEKVKPVLKRGIITNK